MDSYDTVYCVFDQDTHAHFGQASHLATSSKMKLARSWPCFEFLILLHYRHTRHPYASTPGKSAAENCMADLRKSFPDYEKNAKDLFGTLLPLLDTAQVRAAKALGDANRTGEENPSTEMHELVEYLQNLKA